MNISLILTCEHASAEIPTEFKELFSSHTDLLKTHSAIDIGAILLWSCFKNYLPEAVSLAIKGDYSRLLIDLNRSKGHKNLFSSITKSFDKKTKKEISETYYYPYRQTIIEHINKQTPPILHLSIHTFTPILNDRVRQTDIGLLYNPQRIYEKRFCNIWAKKIQATGYQARMNYPYYGKADGLTSFLRKHYLPEKYWGIELEVNQRFFLENLQPTALINILAATFFSAMQEISLSNSKEV